MNEHFLTLHTFRKLVITVLLSFSVQSNFLWARNDIMLNLRSVDIQALIDTVAEVTGKNFDVDPQVSGQVTIVSTKGMSENELYQVFLSAIQAAGYTAINQGSVVRIVPSSQARQQGALLGLPGGTYETRVIPLQHIKADQLLPVIQPLLPQSGQISVYQPSNALIVSDLPQNIDRISEIIKRVDYINNQEVEVIRLQHAIARQVAQTLQALLGQQSNAPIEIVADDRTNSILLSGQRTDRLRFRTLIAHLDTPVEVVSGGTEVIYLHHAKAKNLEEVLIGSGVASIKFDEKTGMQAVRTQGAYGNNEEVSIRADEATNALVVTAPPDVMDNIKRVIARLDVRRAQVLVEAIIAEVSFETSRNLGVQWMINGSNDGFAVGTVQFGQSGVSMGAVNNMIRGAMNNQLINSGVDGAVLAMGDLTGDFQFGVLLNALGGSSDANILSTPSLVALDNEEAEIVVGQNVPFVTGSYTPSGDGTSNPFQTIERQDVGLKLKIKPQINEGNAVVMEVYQEVSNIVPSAYQSTQGPTTQKRALKTSVLIEDDEILVLGGLVDNSSSEGVQKVPGLGDAPVIGGLFRNKKTSSVKRNLMIFLHPKILRHNIDNALVTGSKYDFMRDRQLMSGLQQDAVLPPRKVDLSQPRQGKAAPIIERGRSFEELLQP